MRPAATMDSQQPAAGGTDVGQEPSPLGQTTDFLTWAVCLPRCIAMCRTAFSSHLVRSFSASWHGSSLPSKTFPVPAPHHGCFGHSGPGLSRKRLHRLAMQWVLHVWTYCLNFLYLGRHPTLSELGRRPNAWHQRCFQRFRSLLFVCGDSDQPFPVVPGRSGRELGAALFQLEKFLERNEIKSENYVAHKPMPFSDDLGLLPASKYPQLSHYRSLDPSRLKLVGDGKWPMAKHLDGPFWLPFVEPRFLLHGQELHSSDLPSFVHENREDNLQLCKLWDARGLLSATVAPFFLGISLEYSMNTNLLTLTARLVTADCRMQGSAALMGHQHFCPLVFCCAICG